MIKENQEKYTDSSLTHDLGLWFCRSVWTSQTILCLTDELFMFITDTTNGWAKGIWCVSDIKQPGIALGPIRLYKFPNTRGLQSWKFLFQAEELLIHSLPRNKRASRVRESKDDNWGQFRWTGIVPTMTINKCPTFVPYEQVRHLGKSYNKPPHLELRPKFTMKVILDNNEKVSDYYDLE